MFLFQSGKEENFIKKKKNSNEGKVNEFDRPETGVDPSVMRMDDQLRSLSTGEFPHSHLGCFFWFTVRARA